MNEGEKTKRENKKESDRTTEKKWKYIDSYREKEHKKISHDPPCYTTD